MERRLSRLPTNKVVTHDDKEGEEIEVDLIQGWQKPLVSIDREFVYYGVIRWHQGIMK